MEDKEKEIYSRDFKGVWIPKEIWCDENLNLMERCFMVEIDSLDNENGCYASNDYFSKFFKLSKNRCSEIIKGLEKKGYITISYQYKEGTKSIEKRFIQVFDKSNRGIRESDRGIRKTDRGTRKTERGYSENREDNNTSFNNTVNNTFNNNKGGCCEEAKEPDPKDKKQKTSKPDIIDTMFSEYASGELYSILVDFKKMRADMRKPLSERAAKLLLNKLDSLASGDYEKIKLLEESILNGWASVYPPKQKNNYKKNTEEVVKDLLQGDSSYLDQGGMWDDFKSI